MTYDLNIPISFQLDRTAIDRLKLILSRLSRFNDCTVALNYSTDNVNSKKHLRPIEINDLFDFSTLQSSHSLKIINRLTIQTDQPLMHEEIESLKAHFDLIALRTSSLDVFRSACASYDIDLISLDCKERLAFELNTRDIQLALDRDIYFELCYAPSIRDNQLKTYTIQLAKQLFEYTKGHKLIISSEAEFVSEIRNPADIFYFAKAIGLPNDLAKFTVEKHPEQLMERKRMKH
ncbi:Ribonuclease P protein subunit p30 [Choanephora cucurbitarum]|uniref:Ribonuclease P protein subunit p30 n=1 Tax=Choanephora cucurbitarum TaxID=101091 RepID=A0A1C7MY05_9FUNG|nr:Ribonuclease P protein subunit p30 [Choanephora cucurbitarum]